MIRHDRYNTARSCLPSTNAVIFVRKVSIRSQHWRSSAEKAGKVDAGHGWSRTPNSTIFPESLIDFSRSGCVATESQSRFCQATSNWFLTSNKAVSSQFTHLLTLVLVSAPQDNPVSRLVPILHLPLPTPQIRAVGLETRLEVRTRTLVGCQFSLKFPTGTLSNTHEPNGFRFDDSVRRLVLSRVVLACRMHARRPLHPGPLVRWLNSKAIACS